MLLSLVLSCVACLPCPPVQRASARPVPASCKPSAPLGVDLIATPGPDGLVELEYTLTARLDLAWVRAEIVPVHGGRVLVSQTPAENALDHGVTRSGRAIFDPPAAARDGLQSAEVRVSVHLGLPQPDGSIDALAVEAAVVVGAGPLPLEGRRVTVNGAIGVAERWEVAAVHRSSPTPPAATGAADGGTSEMSVRGEFRYIDREFTYAQGWSGGEPELPVRLARVQVIDAGTNEVLAESATGLDGRFDIRLPAEASAGGPRDLVVHCLAECTQVGPDTIVVEPTEAIPPAFVPYSMSGPVFEGWDTTTDLDAGVVVAQKVFSGNQQGNPFNLLDMSVEAFRYVDALGMPPSTPPLQVLWPVPGGATNGNADRLVLATDEGYDDMVVLHELGHSMDFRYGSPDAGGAAHWFGQSDQPPDSSLAEGFATYFGSAVKQFAGAPGPGIYFDGTGTSATGPGSIQLHMRLETRVPYAGVTGGEADEVAVAASLWNFADTAATDDGNDVDDDLVDGSFLFGGHLTGEQLVMRGMSSPTMLESGWVNVIDLWDSFFVDLGMDAHYAQMTGAFQQNKIAVIRDGSEPDDMPEEATPLPFGDDWGPLHSLVYAREYPFAPGAHDRDHFAIEVPANTIFEVETRYPFGIADAETYADTAIHVTGPGGEPHGFAAYGGQGRNARLQMASGEAGTYIARVSTMNPYRRTGRYQVRTRSLGSLQTPVITSLTPDEVVSVSSGYLISLTVHGEHFTGLSEVTVGGVSAYFGVIADDQATVTMPPVQVLGPQDVVLRNNVGEAVAQVTVTSPDPPALNVHSGFPNWWFESIPVWMGAEPGETVFLFLSFSDLPTSIPGVVDLGIGDGGSDLNLVGSWLLPAGGVVQEFFRRPEGFTETLDVWAQAAVVRLDGTIVPTNIEQGFLEPLD